MRFSYSTNAFKKYDVFKAVSLIAQNGFEGVELLADRPHLYPPDFTKEKLIELKNHIEKEGLSVSNLNTFTLFAVQDMHHPSWLDDNRNIRINHTIDCIKIAHLLGCPNISIQPGGHGERTKENLDLFIDGLKKVIPTAKEYNIKILVEPEPDLFIENVQQFKDFLRAIDDPIVGLNCDIGHFVCVGDDPATVIKDLKDYIGHMHIEDIKDRIHDHKICGEGDIKFQPIFNAIRDIGYKGFISVELYPYQDNPVEAGKKSLIHLRKYI